MLRASWVIFNGLFLTYSQANPRIAVWVGEGVLTHAALHLLDRVTTNVTSADLIREIDQVEGTIRATDFARLCREANGRVRDGSPNRLARITADLSALREQLLQRGVGSASADLGRATIAFLGGPSDLGTVRLPSVSFAGSTWMEAARHAVRYEANWLSQLAREFCILPPPPPQQIRCNCSTRCVDPNRIGDSYIRGWVRFEFDALGNCQATLPAQATQFCRAHLRLPNAYGETISDDISCRRVPRQDPNAQPHAGNANPRGNQPAHR